MTTIDEMAQTGSAADHCAVTSPARAAVVAAGKRAETLLSRGIDGFELQQISTEELMPTRSRGIPVLTVYAGGEPELVSLYRLSSVVLSPSAAADRALVTIGVRARRICRFGFAADPAEFSPAHYSAAAFDGAGDPALVNLLYTGPLDQSAEVDSLLEALRIAAQHDSRLNLITAAGTAQLYASADLLLMPGRSDLHGQAIVEAQASGLPVLAVQEGAALELIESGRSGCLVPSGPFAFGEAIRWLARRATLRERLATGGLHAAREWTWQRSAAQLSAALEAALRQDHGPAVRAA